MSSKCIHPALLLAILLATGCGKPGIVPVAPSSAGSPQPQVLSPAEAVARVRWIGKRQLAMQTNAAYHVSIWNLPESRKIEIQTLDKLASAPWLLLGRKADPDADARLRPLVDDLLQQESYLEVHRATNQPGELVWAIRLDDQRAALWETNLAAVLESLTGIKPVAVAGSQPGWSLRKHHEPNLIQLSRVGGWTLVGMADDQNRLFDEIGSRIARDLAPFEAEISRPWFYAALDLPRLQGLFSTRLDRPPRWPKISVFAVGEGAHVRTRGQLNFAETLPIELDPWNVPTSIMDGPLASFTAIRGFKPCMASSKAWQDLLIGPPPNQLYIWALTGSQVHTYAAAPLQDASNQVWRLTELVLQKWGHFFLTNDLAKFDRSQHFNGLEWHGLPWLTPSLQALVTSNGNFVFGGLFPNQPVSPPPQEYFDNALAGTNLVYYDWELTAPRLEQWLHIGQFTRHVSLRAQMPFQCAGLNWLKTIGPKLDQSVTRITSTGHSQFSFDRTASIGFTAVELHLLADWLESPRFPIGLHTFLAPGEQTQ